MTNQIKNFIEKLRKPFDQKVYAIPYAGDLFEEQAKKLIKMIMEEVKGLRHEIQQNEMPLGNEQWKEGHTKCLNEVLELLDTISSKLKAVQQKTLAEVAQEVEALECDTTNIPFGYYEESEVVGGFDLAIEKVLQIINKKIK